MRRKFFWLSSFVLLVVGAILVFLFLFYNRLHYSAPPRSLSVKENDAVENNHYQPHFIEQPSSVRALYVSQCGAASGAVRRHIMRLLQETEVNAVVIDVKDYTGTISFPHSNTLLLSGGKGCVVSDLKEWVAQLHRMGVYVIGRITVFQDPLYAHAHPEQAVHRRSATSTPWRDYHGLAFIDVGARPFWHYIVTLGKEAHALGFDELNFDYIRYPSDGPMEDAYYSLSGGGDGRVVDKSVPLELFFRFLHKELKRPHLNHTPVLSADLFGMTTTNYDDLWIGQIQEKATPYFDVLAPMVYPSHYPRHFLGFDNPNNHVYDVVHYSLTTAAERLRATTTPVASIAHHESISVYGKPRFQKPARDPQKVLRPWLQDFNYGGIYDAAKVRAQIQATYDAGLDSWMLWDPANSYTPTALKKVSDTR